MNDEITPKKQNSDKAAGKESISQLLTDSKVAPQLAKVYKRFYGSKPSTYIEFIYGMLIKDAIKGNMKAIDLLYRALQYIFDQQSSDEELATILNDCYDIEMIETRLYEETPSKFYDDSLEDDRERNR